MKDGYFQFKPMTVVGFLSGLAFNFQWLGTESIFPDVPWKDAGWWLAGTSVFLGLFTFLYLLMILMEKAFLNWTSQHFPFWTQTSRSLRSGLMRLSLRWQGVALGYLAGAVVRYTVTLIMYRECESLLAAWLHLGLFCVCVLIQKCRQFLISKELTEP